VTFITSKNVNNPLLAYTITLQFHFVSGVNHGVITLFTIASIVAAEKRPLSYQMLQSVHRARNCGVQTLPFTMHYGGEKLGVNRGRNGWILTPNESVLAFGVPVYSVKFHQKNE